MNKAEILAILNRVEANYPVDTWKVNGLHVWPILRIRLAERLFKRSLKTDNSSPPAPPVKKSVFHSARLLIKNLAMLPGALQKLWHFRAGVDHVYLASGIHRTELPDGWFSRFADPLIAEDQASGKTSLLLEFDSPKRYPTPRVHESSVAVMQPFSPLIYGAAKLYYRLASVRRWLPQYEDFREDLRRQGFDDIAQELSGAAITYRSLVVWLYSRFFQRWLRRFRPASVFVVSYYSVEAMALCDAAFRLNIPTVEIQHGVQGPLHTSYARWDKVPALGYSVLPKIFWTWNESSAATIRAWSKPHAYHQAFVGGNPWLTYWQKEGSHAPSTSLPDRMILYSLQPVSPLFPPFLVEAIRATQDDYQWWIRLHPRQLKEQETIVNEIKALGLLDFVNVQEATSLPLFTLLAQTRVHITQWSTVIWEAAAFGVPSIAVHPTGKDLFQDELPQDLLYYADGADELCRLLRELSSRKSAPITMASSNQQSLLRLSELLIRK